MTYKLSCVAVHLTARKRSVTYGTCTGWPKK